MCWIRSRKWQFLKILLKDNVCEFQKLQKHWQGTVSEALKGALNISELEAVAPSENKAAQALVFNYMKIGFK